jgi:ribosomal protein S1
MNEWEVLRYVHKIGSPIKGTVIDFVDNAFVLLKTDTDYRCLLPLDSIEETFFRPKHLPNIGEEINTVVLNCVERVLYLSARASDTSAKNIQQWQLYYDFIDTLEIGSIIKGTLLSSQPFGLFIDIGAPYIGLIDVGHARFFGDDPLPQDSLVWPVKGEEINCKVSYFRLHNKQIGLGWIKPK